MVFSPRDATGFIENGELLMVLPLAGCACGLWLARKILGWRPNQYQFRNEKRGETVVQEWNQDAVTAVMLYRNVRQS